MPFGRTTFSRFWFAFSFAPFLRDDPPILFGFGPKGWFQSRDEVWSKCSLEAFLQHLLSMATLRLLSSRSLLVLVHTTPSWFLSWVLSRLTRCEETDRPGEGGIYMPSCSFQFNSEIWIPTCLLSLRSDSDLSVRKEVWKSSLSDMVMNDVFCKTLRYGLLTLNSLSFCGFKEEKEIDWVRHKPYGCHK